MIEAAAVAAALDRVRDRIASAGDPEAVRVVAVTKGFGDDAVRAAVAAGLADVGENYAQELTRKWEATEGAGAHWHFLGALQRNKLTRLAKFVNCWQSVARLEEGVQIARLAPGAVVLVQVRTGEATERNGVAESEVAPLVASLVDLGLDVRGLMAVAPLDPALAPASFAGVVALADRLGLPERSIGMTGDLEAAVACGSTMVRIGRALFGPRPGPAA